jgi:hypothetical protein
MRLGASGRAANGWLLGITINLLSYFDVDVAGTIDQTPPRAIRMRRPNLVPLALGTVLSQPLSANQKSASDPNLRDRILAANTFQYCRPIHGCSNPQVIAVESGYIVIEFIGPEPQTSHVRPNELADYLQALPE